MRTIQKYGWHPDLPDHRDFKFSVPFLKCLFQPASVDLRSACPPVYDQLSLGSCTANAIGAMDQFVRMKEGIDAFMPSRLFIYYNERDAEGTVGYDSGANLRDGMASIANQGVCPETMLPYDVSNFIQTPAENCYLVAKQHEAITYLSVDQQLSDMKHCLLEGYPFVFGFTVFESFESRAVASNGVVPMPTQGEGTVGGHAVMCVGYFDAPKVFIVRNSWSDQWGDHGYCYMPYDYLLNPGLASNFWTLRKAA